MRRGDLWRSGFRAACRTGLLGIVATGVMSGVTFGSQQDAAEKVRSLIKDLTSSALGRAEAAKALGDLGPAAVAAVPYLAQHLGDTGRVRRIYGPGVSAPAEVREFVVEALEKIGVIGVEPLLEASLDYPFPSSRSHARLIRSQALTEWGRTVGTIVRCPRAPAPCDRTAFERVQAFAFARKSGPLDDRMRAVHLFSNLFSMESTNALADMLTDQDTDVRWIAVQALGGRAALVTDTPPPIQSRAREAFLISLTNSDERVRTFAYRALLRSEQYAARVQAACPEIANRPCALP